MDRRPKRPPATLTYRIVRLAVAMLIAALSVTVGAGGDDAFRVALVGSTEDQRTVTVMSAVEAALADACGTHCAVVTRVDATLATSDLERAVAAVDFVVTIGSHAGQVMAQAARKTPTLYAFLPRVAWDELQTCCLPPTRPFSALLIDQPLQRQIALTRLVVPQATRLGVLLGEVSSERRDELEDAARARGYRLTVEQASADDIGAGLRRLVQDVDVLLALPDPAIYNRSTAYSILLTTYSARVPVIGFSEAMVKAGAAAAVHATPKDVGREVAQRIDTFRRTGQLQPAGYGDLFSVSVNREVLRSLQLPDFSDDDLLRSMERMAP